MFTPDKTHFRWTFSEGWIHPEVEKYVSNFFRERFPQFTDCTSFVSSFVRSGTVPGVNDNGTETQFFAEGFSRTFSGSVNPDLLLSKKITLRMNVGGYYFNWLLLYMQFILYYKKRNINNDIVEVDTFLKPIYLHLLDDDKNIIAQFEFSQLQMESIPDLELDSSSTTLDIQTFDVVFRFNVMKIKFLFDNIINHRNEQYSY
jgi:hypothetical protein